MNALAILLAAGALTFALRSSTVHLMSHRALSPRLTRALAGALPAGLVATITVPLVARGGDPQPSKLVALVVAAIVARVTNQVGFVIASGMAAYWLLALAR